MEVSHIAQTSHPELQAFVGFMAQFMEDPRASHMQALKKAIPYIRQVFDRCIVYYPIDMQLEGAVDSD